MRATEILNYISEETLSGLEATTRVNEQVKKLEGSTVFRLICFTMLNTERTSLRTMEHFYHSLAFKNVCCGKELKSIRYNSISDRLSTIKVEFFEKIFAESCQKFASHFQGKAADILRFDSTLIGLSSKLINSEMKVGSKGNTKRQLKFTIGLKQIPVSACLFNQKAYMSEDMALKEAIFSSKEALNDTVVFDRGLSSAQTLDELSEKSISFVTRARLSRYFEVIETAKVSPDQQNEDIRIEKDCIVRLNKGKKQSKIPIRYIEATLTKDDKPIGFLTNIEDLSPLDIAQIYKKRWEIETFFKFIKQELNFSHLVSRNENGIRVMLYVTLTLAIFLTVYKKLNNLKGYKIPKLRFAQELETEIIKDIVLLCGGDPSKIDQLYFKQSSEHL
jgi:Transposase DDE domain